MIHFQDHALLLNESAFHWFGQRLVDEQDPGKVLEALNETNLVIFSTGLETTPAFNYGNVKALAMFGCDLAALIQITLGDSILAEDQQAFELTLAAMQEQGSVSHTQVKLKSPQGKLWQVAQGRIWQLMDSLGRIHGLGYCFAEWAKIET